MIDTGPKHPVWNGAPTLEPTELNHRAAEMMMHFYLSQGFSEAPTWEEIGDDFRFGFIAVVERMDKTVAAERERCERVLLALLHESYSMTGPACVQRALAAIRKGE